MNEPDDQAISVGRAEAREPLPATFSRALVRRIAAYVRGFTVPPPSGSANGDWKLLQNVADMIEAQEHALIQSTPLAAGVEAGGPLRALIAEMRNTRSRYKSHDLGCVDSVSANRVDEWADELEALLSAPVASPPEAKEQP